MATPIIEFRLPDLNPDAADAPFYVYVDDAAIIPEDAIVIRTFDFYGYGNYTANPYDPEFIAEIRARRS